MRLAFIGLGIMGGPMAGHLLAAGHALVVHTRTQPRADELLDRGVIHGAKPGAIVVDHSTISPAATREMAAALARRDVIVLDAPISGGDVGARNATLSIMVGGDAQAFATVEPLLRLMGKTITHCGESGTGQLTKLVNQILVTVTNLARSEEHTS